MFQEYTKIIDFLFEGQIEPARQLFSQLKEKDSMTDVVEYLILLTEDQTIAIDFWKQVSKKGIDALFVLFIEEYNLYKSNQLTVLKENLLHKDLSQVHNYVEAENLAYYAYQLELEKSQEFLKKSQQLKITSDLLVPEHKINEFSLYSPLTLVRIHFHVLQFLNQNFETENEVNDWLDRLKNNKPL